MMNANAMNDDVLYILIYLLETEQVYATGVFFSLLYVAQAWSLRLCFLDLPMSMIGALAQFGDHLYKT